MLKTTELELSNAHITKMLNNKDLSCFKILRYCIILHINVEMPTLHINVEMPTNVGISTFISRINFVDLSIAKVL